MQSPEASGPGALAGLPTTLISVIATPSTSPLGLVSSQTQIIPNATQTASALSQKQIQERLQHVISSLSSTSDATTKHVVAASGDSSGSTGQGILIGILSAFGSAAIAFVVLAIFFFFKYTRRGRIMLDRIGRPGEYDDEQAFLREEEEALETMDDLTRSEYLRAKGMRFVNLAGIIEGSFLTDSCCSFHPGQPPGIHANRYFTVAVPCHSRKGRLRLGVSTRIRDCQLFCGSADRD